MISWIVLVLLSVSSLPLVPSAIAPRSPLYPGPRTREVPRAMGGWWASPGDSCGPPAPPDSACADSVRAGTVEEFDKMLRCLRVRIRNAEIREYIRTHGC